MLVSITKGISIHGEIRLSTLLSHYMGYEELDW